MTDISTKDATEKAIRRMRGMAEIIYALVEQKSDISDECLELLAIESMRIADELESATA